MSKDVTYSDYAVVATGIKGQIEACLNALDNHVDLPKEGEDLGKTLAAAHKLCETILTKADKEPKDDVE